MMMITQNILHHANDNIFVEPENTIITATVLFVNVVKMQNPFSIFCVLFFTGV